ncbi:Abi family protein [Salinarimonas ramus]|uniref:Abi family protein n=1 Tax=Salinarimonas ramus TaxID=690164 RepID=UPI00166AF49D|nr:Abi family protein [Salinarimonas ramus]
MKLDSPSLQALQAVFLDDEESVNAFIKAVSQPRFSRYLKACRGNKREVIDLYLPNSKLSQSLYLLIQIWEVCLRNKLNDFLCWKYNGSWPKDTRLQRNLTANDRRRLNEAITRQSEARKVPHPPTGAIVADLSAGFWVSLLAKSYDVPFSWRYNLSQVYPHAAGIKRAEASDICSALLDLRNRIAHHEPIYHLDLALLKRQLDEQIEGMCRASAAFAAHACTFAHHWTILSQTGAPAPPSSENSN